MRVPLGCLLVGALALLAAAGCTKPPPPDALPTPDEIAAGYLAYSATPLDREALQFKLLVPKDWREQTLMLDQATLLFDDSEFVPLARFVSPDPGPPAVIEVAYLRLRRELDLGDFVEDYLREQDVQVLSSQAARFNQEPVVDVVVAEGGRRGRLAFRKAGALVFLTAGSAAEADSVRRASAIGAALVSFEHPAAPGDALAERVRLYEVGGPLGLKIRKPDTWLAAPVTDAPDGCGGVDLSLREEQTTRALLRLRWADKQTADEGTAKALAETTFQELVAVGVHDVDFLGNGRLLDSGAAPGGTVGLWTGILGGHQVLLRSATFESDRASFVVMLLGPAREQRPELWAAGAQLFSLVSQDVAERVQSQ